MATTSRTRPTRLAHLAACGWRFCPFCDTQQSHPWRAEVIARATEDAQFDREEYGTPDPATALLDGFDMRNFQVETDAIRASRSCGCDGLDDVRRGLDAIGCDVCEYEIRALRCAWALYQTTYEAEFARQESAK